MEALPRAAPPHYIILCTRAWFSRSLRSSSKDGKVLYSLTTHQQSKQDTQVSVTIVGFWYGATELCLERR